MPMNLPNKLTLMRVVLVPFFVFFMLFQGIPHDISKWIALILFCAASLTDLFDGKIARKYNLVTNFGKFMDPLADKILVSVVIAASYWGKFKTNFQMFAIILCIADLGNVSPYIHIAEQILIYIALILTIISMVDYFAKNLDVLKEGGSDQ